MKNPQDTLRQQLRSSGASAAEASELSRLAGRLSSLKITPEAPPLPHKRPFVLRLLPTSAVAVVALLVGMGTVAFAQNSLPGNLLYPVKRLGENMAVAVHPEYRATLMMRRADEVRQLVADGAGSGKVEATLSAYKTEAAAYKTANYSAFVYCKANLQQAETGASPNEKRMIVAVLKNLSDID